ncbi:hypothetical protein Tco_1374778 [Tanacetum coccineum]
MYRSKPGIFDQLGLNRAMACELRGEGVVGCYGGAKLWRENWVRARPTSFEEAYSLARITEARFEDERSTTVIAKTNDLNIKLLVQDLEATIRHKPNKIEAVKTSMVATSEELEQQEYQDDLTEIF